MKRIALILFVLLSGIVSSAQSFDDLAFGTDSTFEVMTWNIEWFPKNGAATIDYVTQIIDALDVDLLAIQEVDDISAFNQVISSLDAYDGYLESSYFAGLAYIYKTDVLQINDIYEIYTSQPYWSPFPRSPMVLDLNFLGERIIVFNNHFKCCGDGKLDQEDSKDEETRRSIASGLLKKYIDENLPDQNAIVLGDLNDILTDKRENNVFQMFLDDSLNYFFPDYGIAMDKESEWSYPSWPSHIDHILITNELFDEFEREGSEIQILKLEQHLPGEWEIYDKNISDHRPLAMKLVMDVATNKTDFRETAVHFAAYPNPVRSETNFSFHIPEGKRIIEIINIQGQVVFSDEIAEGANSYFWSTAYLPRGMYVAKLMVDRQLVATLKILISGD